MPVLPDILDHNLLIVFCGTAPGVKSKERKYYYAGRGNKFWGQFAIITDHELPTVSITDCKKVLNYRIGLTDLNKEEYGLDENLTPECYDIGEFRENMLKYSPKLIVFNGKEAAEKFFSKSPVKYGLQNEKFGSSDIFIAPSTSAASGKDWKKYGPNCWNEIGKMYNDMKRS